MSPIHGAIATVGALSAMHHITPDIVCEGWVLKKRRKKMQVRDQVNLNHAAITTSPGRKDIHIDSNMATFHVKCLSTDDFNTWMGAFRKFISLGVEARRSASLGLPARYVNQSVSLSKSGSIAEEIGSTIKSLEVSIHNLGHEIPVFSKKSHSLGKKSDKERPKDSKEPRFGLFKRSSNHATSPLSSEFGVESSPDSSSENLHPSFHRVLLALETLKSQHATLLASMQTLAEMSQSHQGPPLPPTAEEGILSSRREPSQRLSTPVSRLSRRTSIATSVSDSVHEWYDALDVAEEFVMDAQNLEEQPKMMHMNESQSSLQQETSSIDTDIEDFADIPQSAPISGNKTVEVQRRTRLPSPPVGDEGSLFAILKKNVGKDLSTITFPVTFNEPLTLLQRAAEEVEYYSILDDAASADNPFLVMPTQDIGLAGKPYVDAELRSNPMLGETFEDSRMKFIAEKVRHNPLEMAYHAEGRNWKLNATSSGRTKFWAKIRKKPSSFMRNLMVGTKYLEHTGQMTIENTHDQMRCVLEFKQNGYWGATNVVSGVITGDSGEILMHLEGKWDDQMSQTFDSSNFRILWRATPFPKDTHEFYGFTSYGITLNELTEGLVGRLPPTDSRLRPDVRALEEGNIDLAEAEKVRVEEMQRDRRRQGKDQRPRWFYQKGDQWEYSGGYWEARERGWKTENLHSLW
ncbi:hypothetical protein H0H92_011768 [Tricholoma furcatifolium]|nr:hypothetical protein H0H92_011768 [Tricholoma furcatifolium]